MANLTPISSWTTDDARHLARRAGFGISPEGAVALQAANGGDPVATVNAWVDGTGLDATVFNAALGSADPVTEPGADASGTAGSVDVAPTPGPHRYLVGGADTWRNSLGRGQAYLAFRMQYDPYAFSQRMALFFHNLFATGWTKVNNLSLMLNQWDMLVAHGRDVFTDLLVQVSKDPAMCFWLDSVRNNAAGTRTPNENYAREVMELYSLGVDNGYNQADITNLAIGLAGWSFVVDPADVVTNPTNPDDQWVARGTFAIYDGSPATAGFKRWDLNDLGANLPNMRRPAAIDFLGGSFPASATQGEDAVRSIPVKRPAGQPPNCATFLATRLLRTFVTTQFTAQDVTDVATMIDVAGYDLRAIMKTLLASSYFYANRFALVEGPVSWAVRAARALGYALPTSGSPDASRFPAWALVSGNFADMSQKLLDPNGPNGWKEDVYWLNSNTMRYRTRLAAAVALQETYSTDLGDGNKQYTLFPTDVEAWFPTPPATPNEVFSRLVDLIQPAPIPPGVQALWLDALFPSDGSGNPRLNGASWAAGNAQDRQAARSLAFLVLCSPSGQLY